MLFYFLPNDIRVLNKNAKIAVKFWTFIKIQIITIFSHIFILKEFFSSKEQICCEF